MKKYLLIVLVCFGVKWGMAQPGYFPFPIDSTIWYVQYTKPGLPGFCRTDIFSVQGSELLEGKRYYKLWVDRSYLDDDFDSLQADWLLSYRQDSARRIIYKMPFGILQYLYFDFSRGVGDTAIIYPTSYLISKKIQVVSTDSVLMDNGTYRRSTTVAGDFPSVWIDGIGTTNGWTNDLPDSEFIFSLQCVTQNGVSVYKKDAADCYCNSGVGINDMEISGLTIYPNPTNDGGFYLQSNDEIVDAQLYSHSGQLLKGLNPKGYNNLQGYPAGMYFVQVSTATQKMVRRLVKL
jgi:hypothetical protein